MIGLNMLSYGAVSGMKVRRSVLRSRANGASSAAYKSRALGRHPANARTQVVAGLAHREREKRDSVVDEREPVAWERIENVLLERLCVGGHLFAQDVEWDVRVRVVRPQELVLRLYQSSSKRRKIPDRLFCAFHRRLVCERERRAPRRREHPHRRAEHLQARA